MLAMATTAFSRFAAPTNSNDPVFVIVIVEDSRLMASKWEDIRNHYLLALLESLREADLTVPVCVARRIYFFPNISAICIDACLVAHELSSVLGVEHYRPRRQPMCQHTRP